MHPQKYVLPLGPFKDFLTHSYILNFDAWTLKFETKTSWAPYKAFLVIGLKF